MNEPATQVELYSLVPNYKNTHESRNRRVMMQERTSLRPTSSSTSDSTWARICISVGRKPGRLDCVFDGMSSQTMAVKFGSD